MFRVHATPARRPRFLIPFALGLLMAVGIAIEIDRAGQTLLAQDAQSERSDDVRKQNRKAGSATKNDPPVGEKNEATDDPLRDWPDTKVGRLMRELEELQQKRQTGQLEWGRKMRELILLGQDAFPELIAALDATPREDRLMLRSIPFLLRGIGDKRAIPALIRAIPSCYGKDGSDMGYICEDPELLAFLQEHDNSDRDDRQHYSYGRPLNEVYRTLEEWTGVENGWHKIAYIDANHGTPRQQQLKRALFEDSAIRWAQWWQDNWQDHIDDIEYSRVNLPEFKTDVPIAYCVDLARPLRRVSGASNMIIQSIYNADSDGTFCDLDTGRWSGLPPQFRELPPNELANAKDEIIRWARDQGFDLIGTEVEVNGKSHYTIEPIDLKAWEIPVAMWRSGERFTPQSLIEVGRQVDDVLAHVEPGSDAPDFNKLALFFYITNEGTPGQLYLGVEVRNTNVIPGRAVGNSELNPIGYRKGRRIGLSILAESK